MQCRRYRFDPWVRTFPWRRKRQPTPVFLPGKSHGQRSLEGLNPWGCKKLDMTKWLNNNKPPVSSFLAQMVKNPPAVQETWTRFLVEKVPGRANGYPLQYSRLENSMNKGGNRGWDGWMVSQPNGHDFVQTLGNREAWRAAVHGVTKNQTRLSNRTMKNNITAWNIVHV